MQRNRKWIVGLMMGAASAALVPVEAAELKLGSQRGSLRAAPASTDGLEASEGALNTPDGVIQAWPLSPQAPVVKHGDVSVASVQDKLIYSNTGGKVVFTLGSNQINADDVTFVAKEGCLLRRFKFRVTGVAIPGGTSGPFQIEYGLYPVCPNASPTTPPIEGTTGVFSSDDDTQIVHEIEHVITPGMDISLFPTVYLGFKANRPNTGAVAGTPAEVGFSIDRLDTPNFPCNSSAGGWHASPHASYFIQFYGDESCDDSFPGYVNTRPGRSGFSNGGDRACFADDVRLNILNCNMSGLELTVRANPQAGQGAAIQVRVHQAAGGLPGAQIGPTRLASVGGTPGAHMVRFNYDPPIPLATDQVWVSFQTTSQHVGWVMTGQQADLGGPIPGTGVFGTTAIFARSQGRKQCGQANDWVTATATSPNVGFPENTHVGFDVKILCDGTAPVGACCDMFIRDDGICNIAEQECVGGEFEGEFCLDDVECKGEPKCQNLPEMNCSFPPRGTAFRPRWQQGIPCNRCSGGPNNNQSCDTAEDCPDGTCQTNNAFGTQTPCGLQACCPPDESGCVNRTEKDCFRQPPPYRTNNRQWQLGRYCGVDGQRCFRVACLGRVGNCLEPKPKFCRGGQFDGEQCNVDSECTIRCGQSRCEGGINAGQPCATADNCPGGICIARCTAGDTTRQCTVDAECNDNGVCQTLNDFVCIGGPNVGLPCFADVECPSGTCGNMRCNGGVFHGQVCDGDRDCREAICEGAPGCASPNCCEEVCAFEAQQFGTTFCCDFHWDNVCAQIANDLAGDEGSACAQTPANSSCRPSQRGTSTDGARTVAIGSITDVGMSAAPTNRTDNPGFCCHTGFNRTCNDGSFADQVCDDDIECWDHICQTVCTSGPFRDNPCTNVRQCQPGGPGEFQPCPNGDVDCPGNVCVDIQCSDANSIGECSDLPKCRNSISGEVRPSPTSCANDSVCNTDRFCREPLPDPGAQAEASLWYRFRPESQGQSVRVNTCSSSDIGADNSLLNVFTARNPDAGICQNLGQCAGNPEELCSLLSPECSDGSNCRALDVPLSCSVSEQDCPLGRTCAADITTQCGDLVLVGCNDDSDTCNRPGNSDLCLPNLNDEQTYFIQIGAKTAQNMGNYRLQVITVASCPSTPSNDSCPGAPVVGDGQFAFDLSGATRDCPAPSCGLGNVNDVWFRYVAPVTGEATFETCGSTLEDTPDTEMAVYFDCNCPRWDESPVLGSNRCSFFAGGDCGPGSRLTLDIEAGNCYLVRVGDRGQGESGNLTITSTAPACPPGEVTFDPPSGVVDARQPLDPFNGTLMAGISSLQATGPANAPPSCWELCETDDDGDPIELTVTEDSPGMYTLTLDRAITPGACTTIRYLADGGPQTVGSFIAHPGNVNGDGQADALDLTALVNHLNSGDPVPWGLHSTDINASGMATAADLVALIDVLNGAGPHSAWMGTTIPSCSGCDALD